MQKFRYLGKLPNTFLTLPVLETSQTMKLAAEVQIHPPKMAFQKANQSRGTGCRGNGLCDLRVP